MMIIWFHSLVAVSLHFQVWKIPLKTVGGPKYMKLFPMHFLFKELGEITEFHPSILLIRKLKLKRYKRPLS